MPQKNYHTHTYRCKHASGDAADYCRSGLEQGLRVLGMSDHTPLPDGRWPAARMDLAELAGYCEALRQAQSEFPDLLLLRGMECEYSPEYAGFYADGLRGEWGLDYLIGAAHYVPHQGEWCNTFKHVNEPQALHAYADYFIDSMRSGLFAFMAHPDAFGSAYLEWDAECEACARAMLQAAADLGVPLEINAYGLRKRKIATPRGERRRYPLPEFWELATDYAVQVVVNSDAHRPQDVTAAMAEATAIAVGHGLVLADLSHLETAARRRLGRGD